MKPMLKPHLGYWDTVELCFVFLGVAVSEHQIMFKCMLLCLTHIKNYVLS